MASESDKFGTAFDQAFGELTTSVSLRPEVDADSDFLTALSIACDPMAPILPEPLLQMQARSRQLTHDAEAPQAMRRIAMRGDQAVGRIMIDWKRANGVSYCVDVAVSPEARSNGIGKNMLLAWLIVADANDLQCTLEVTASNPARQIYERIGFVADEGQDEFDPIISMHRPRNSDRQH